MAWYHGYYGYSRPKTNHPSFYMSLWFIQRMEVGKKKVRCGLAMAVLSWWLFLITQFRGNDSCPQWWKAVWTSRRGLHARFINHTVLFLVLMSPDSFVFGSSLFGMEIHLWKSKTAKPADAIVINCSKQFRFKLFVYTLGCPLPS